MNPKRTNKKIVMTNLANLSSPDGVDRFIDRLAAEGIIKIKPDAEKPDLIKDGQLIPVVPTKKVYVVSALYNGEYRPLAVFRRKQSAFNSLKLIGMNAPLRKPRMDAVWMPAKDFGVPQRKENRL